MHLYFIRHAQSANNDLYARTGGSLGRESDPPLTDMGHRQARLLAEHLAGLNSDAAGQPNDLVGEFAARHNRLGYGLTHLYCSLMTRAIQTGGYISMATGLTLYAWPEIHERGGLHNVDEESGEDVGVPGPNRVYFEREFPQLILPDSVGETGWWDRPMETLSEANSRARVVWAQLLDRHGGTEDRVAIVSHAGFFQSLLTCIIGGPQAITSSQLGFDELWFGVSNTSISRLEIEESIMIVRYLNRVDFLPVELITG